MKTIPAISFKDTAAARNRVAAVDLETDYDDFFRITLNGTDDNGQVVYPKFVQVDNFDNIAPVVVTILGISNSVAPYTRTTFEIGQFVPELAVRAYEGTVRLYISEGRLGVGDGSNDYAKDQVGNMGTYLNRDGSQPMVADLDMNGSLIINLKPPAKKTDAATKDYTDNAAYDRVVSQGGKLDRTGDSAPALLAAYNALPIVAGNYPAGWGRGRIAIKEGTLVMGATFAPTAPIGLTITGAAPIASVFEWNKAVDGIYLKTYIAPAIRDISLVQSTPNANDTVAINTVGDGGGHFTIVENVWIKGWGVALTVGGATGNGDFVYMVNCEISANYAYHDNYKGIAPNGQAVNNLLFHCSVGAIQAVVGHLSGGRVMVSASGLNIYKAVVEVGNTTVSQSSEVVLRDNKMEYTGDGNYPKLLYDARNANLNPNAGGADTRLTWRDNFFRGGDNPPADPDNAPTIVIANGRHRLDFLGGYLRGILSRFSDFVENKARDSFRYMEAAPHPDKVQFTGTGTHPLTEWEACDNVGVDRYLGGQSGVYPIKPVKAVRFDVFSTYIINTGVNVFQTDLDGRKGLQHSPKLFPNDTLVRGLWVFVEQSDGFDTVIKWFTDASYSVLLDQVVIPANTRRRWFEVSQKRVTLPDGTISLRYTKPGIGQTTVGHICVEHNTYMGATN